MSFLNSVVPGERTCYRAQSTVCQAIIELAIKSCGKWQENLAPHSVITMDGSWHERRNASHRVVDFVDLVSGKIFAYNTFDGPIEFSDGSAFHSSNRVDVDCVRRIVD
jgi:hypothetical protein